MHCLPPVSVHSGWPDVFIVLCWSIYLVHNRTLELAAFKDNILSYESMSGVQQAPFILSNCFSLPFHSFCFWFALLQVTSFIPPSDLSGRNTVHRLANNVCQCSQKPTWLTFLVPFICLLLYWIVRVNWCTFYVECILTVDNLNMFYSCSHTFTSIVKHSPYEWSNFNP